MIAESDAPIGAARAFRGRLARAVSFALAFAIVVSATVYTSFDAGRTKALQSPVHASGGKVVVGAVVPPADAVLHPPFALIARVANESSSTERFTIRLNEQVVCTRAVAAHAASRLDCAPNVTWTTPGTATISAESGDSSWSLLYLEIATHHGATQAYDLVVVPAASRNYGRVGWLATLFVFLAVFGLMLLDVRVPSRAARYAHGAAAAVVSVVLLLAFVAPMLSRFRVLVSVRAAAWCGVILFLPRLIETYRLAGERVGRRAVTAALAVVVVGVCYGSVAARLVNEVYGGNVSGVLHISRIKYDQDPLLASRTDIRDTLVLNDGGGFDGEYMYFALFDPLLRHYKDHPAAYNTFIDAVPYRYDRIGYIWLTRALAWTGWRAYPATMEGIVLVSLMACAALAAALAADYGLSPFWGAAIALIPGFWQSLQDGLPEPLTAALLLAGFFAVRRGKLPVAAMSFAAALLVRETGLIFVVAVTAIAMRHVKLSTRAVFVACAVAPIALWKLYVGLVLLADWGPWVFLYQPGNMTFPFIGIRHMWAAIGNGSGAYDAPSLIRSGITFSVLLMLAAGAAIASAVRGWSAPAAASLGYATMALCFDYNSVWIHVSNAQRITFDLFLMLLLASFELGRRGRLRWVMPVFWAATAVYVFWGAFDAPFIRAALPL